MSNQTAQFGNLNVQSIKETAKVFESKADFAEKAADGFRWSFVTYKKTKDNPTPPANFAVQLPVVSADDVIGLDRGEEFIAALAQDYQDEILRACVAMESLVQPTDWPKIVADYFDTTRGGVKRVDVLKWYDDVFTPVFVARQIERAAELGNPGLSDEQVSRIVNGYKTYVSGLCAKSLESCGVSLQQQTAVRQTLERLIELGKIDKDDETAKFLLAQIAKFSKRPEEVIEVSV